MKRGDRNETKADPPEKLPLLLPQLRIWQYIEGDTEVLCSRNGVMQPEDKCRGYVYDPLKRKPLRQMIDIDYQPEEFEL